MHDLRVTWRETHTTMFLFIIYLVSSESFFFFFFKEYLKLATHTRNVFVTSEELTREKGTCVEDVVVRSTVWWGLARPACAQSREPSLRIWYPWTPPSLTHPRWSRNHRPRYRRRRLNWNRNRPHCPRQGNCWNLRPQGTPRPVAAAWRSARVHTWNINLHVTNVNAICRGDTSSIENDFVRCLPTLLNCKNYREILFLKPRFIVIAAPFFKVDVKVTYISDVRNLLLAI